MLGCAVNDRAKDSVRTKTFFDCCGVVVSLVINTPSTRRCFGLLDCASGQDSAGNKVSQIWSWYHRHKRSILSASWTWALNATAFDGFGHQVFDGQISGAKRSIESMFKAGFATKNIVDVFSSFFDGYTAIAREVKVFSHFWNANEWSNNFKELFELWLLFRIVNSVANHGEGRSHQGPLGIKKLISPEVSNIGRLLLLFNSREEGFRVG